MNTVNSDIELISHFIVYNLICYSREVIYCYNTISCKMSYWNESVKESEPVW